MRATVFNYIECDYNRWRRHSWCGGLSPEQFENKNLALGLCPYYVGRSVSRRTRLHPEEI